MDLLNAKEAHRRSRLYNQRTFGKHFLEMENVLFMIAESIKRGLTTVSIILNEKDAVMKFSVQPPLAPVYEPSKCVKEVVKELSKLGYKVNFRMGRRGGYLDIFWD